MTEQQIVGAYTAEQWEDFTQEWASSLQAKFKKVERISGAGDKGRDLICLECEPIAPSRWANYQCKHYDRPLLPSEIWVELGKLCYYTWKGDFPVPREYRFVAPHDVGPKLHHFLSKPAKLREELVKAWPDACQRKITSVEVPLTGPLKAYVEAFDFSIVGYTPVAEILAGHRTTRFWQERFRTVLPKRPDAIEPPPSLTGEETVYVAKLLAAYGEAAKQSFPTVDTLAQTTPYPGHLKRSRRAFFRAEQLNRFSRELFAPGTFDKLKDQIHDGVADTVATAHAHGYARVLAATEAARNLQLGNSDLSALVEVADRHGICHHLANEDRIEWVNP